MQWGTEHLFNKYYSHLPQWKIEVGYIGGKEDAKDPCALLPTFPTH